MIKPKDDQEYKRCRLAKKTPKKEGYFTVFWKKDQNNKNIPYTDGDLGDELVIVVIDNCHCGLFIIPKEVAISKKILSTKDCSANESFSLRILDVYSSFSLSFTVLFFFLYLKILFNSTSFVNPKLVKK